MNTKTRGRPPLKPEPAAFAAAVDRFRAGEITAQRAAAELGISRRSLFRKIKEQSAAEKAV